MKALALPQKIKTMTLVELVERPYPGHTIQTHHFPARKADATERPFEYLRTESAPRMFSRNSKTVQIYRLAGFFARP